jgi:hypothetical protein
MVAYAYNPRTWEVEAGGSLIGENLSLKQIKQHPKINCNQ